MMEQPKSVNSDLLKVVAEALLDNIKTKDTRTVEEFFNTLDEEIVDQLFPFSPKNKGRGFTAREHQSVRWRRYPYPFLHAACEFGTLDLCLFLLDVGVDPSLQTEQDGTALEVATVNRKLPFITKLLEWDISLIDNVDTIKGLLAKACRIGHLEMVEFWLAKLAKTKHGQPLCKDDFVPNNDPFIAACKGKHYQLACSLVDRNIVAITAETSFQTMEHLTEVLRLWCDTEEDETHKRNVSVANWNNRNLEIFDVGWMMPNSNLCSQLVSIHLSQNTLKRIPRGLLWELPCLESLDLSHNRITSLPGPDSMEHLTDTRLTYLNVSNNKLSYPVLEIFMLPLLEKLDLSHNNIDSLNHKRFPSQLIKPDEGQLIWNLSNMATLNLASNRIMRIPHDISTAKSLRKLYISNNKLSKLPAPWNCPLTELIASGNSIEELPDMHGHWSRSLAVLDLSDNNLAEIPWTICQLTALSNLNLSNNSITRLPSADGDWNIYSLKELKLANNRLFYVQEPSAPASPSLPVKKISFAKKHLSRTSMIDPGQPQGMCHSTGKTGQVSLSFPEIFNDTLFNLDLSYNQLQDVPPTISKLTCLHQLDLSGNTSIERLPYSLAQLGNLYSLRLEGLTIKDPDTVAEVNLQMGSQTRNILEKLREKYLSCSRYYGVKLMLIGPKKSGKTSLLASLTGKEQDDDLGINISFWTLQDQTVSETKTSLKSRFSRSSTCSPKPEVVFSTWDLKGGKLNSIIHQCFFTQRALYLLVWDVRNGISGVNKLQPWLLNIQSRASESVIIIVLTHLDKLRKNQSLQAIRDSITAKYTIQDGFPAISMILEVTATGPDGQGINELRQAIHRCVMARKVKKKSHSGHPSTVPFVGQMIPRTYLVLQEILANESNRRMRSLPPLPPVMTEAELASQVKKIPDSKVETGQDIAEAIEFLSTCGSLVHFSDHLQGLTNLYFIDPIWLYNILHDVANVDRDVVREGRIHKNNLADLHKASSFGQSRFKEYLQLLERLEILLPLSRIEFLIPSRLPKEKPGQDLSLSLRDTGTLRTLHRLYKLPYIPPGFWSRLVSRIFVSLKQHNEVASPKRSETRSRNTGSFKRNSRMSMRVSFSLSHSNIIYWQQGVHVLHHTGRILLKPLTFQDSKPGICIQIHCRDGEFKAMGFMVDEIENLIKEWYPGLLGFNTLTSLPLVQRLIPCPVCLEVQADRENACSPQPAESLENCKLFSVSELALARTIGEKTEVECVHHPERMVQLAKLIPDLLLIDLPVRPLDKNEFDFDPCSSQSLGSGGYGEVFKANFRDQPVAVKMLIRSTFFKQNAGPATLSRGSSCGSDSGMGSMSPVMIPPDSNADDKVEFVMTGFANLRREVVTMSKLKHPCIVQLVGTSIRNLSFAMELAPYGDLESYLRKEMDRQRESFQNQKVYQTLLDRVLTYKIALQIAQGVSYLHRMLVIYSDLKTDNVLMCSLKLDAPVNIKLTDYGIARNMDLQGARGLAGPMGFCAPEILRGQTFTKKVDWFSYSMLLYHLLTGAWPYENLKSAIDIRNAVNMGVKPSFQFRDYSMVTLFPHLERLMRSCWNDNPLMRPSAKVITAAMADASFLCLTNVIPLKTETITCLHPGSRELHENSERLWFWTGSDASRQYAKLHVKYFSEEDFKVKPLPGPLVNCMVQVGNLEIVGTKNNIIQVHGPPAIGPQVNVHQEDLYLDGEVLCLCYQPVHRKKDVQGQLFAGLADGHVDIFNHVKPTVDTEGRTSNWTRLKTLTLEDERCNLLDNIPEREELWIACGNKLRVVSTKVMLLDGPAILVTPRADHCLLSLTHHRDNLFCIVEQSCRVLQYSLISRELIQVLQCGPSPCGECLVAPPSSVPEETEEVAAAELGDTERDEDSDESSDGIDVEEIEYHEKHFDRPDVPVRGGASTLPVMGKNPFPAILRPFSDIIQRPASVASATVAPHASSLVTVKDCLWIGMSTGETLVVCAVNNNHRGYKFGELLAVLRLNPELGGDNGGVEKLLLAGKEHVVAWQDVGPTQDAGSQGGGGPCSYQLLVWKAWGSNDIWKFRRICQMLDDEINNAVGI